MTALTSPKGPLPARVYWFRRVMALSVLFVLVFGTTRIISGSGDASTGAEQATTVAAPVKNAAPEGQQKDAKKSDEPADQKPSAEPSPSATPTPTPTEKPKPVPTGPCANSDVVVRPDVSGPRTSVKMKINLTLRTRTAEACTFEVSPKTLVVKVDSGPRERPDDIWSTAQCPKAVPTKSVTLYKEHDTTLDVVWSGRRSDASCSQRTSWAKRGWYHAKAATYGGEPTTKQFEMTRISPVTVTRTVEPKQKKTKEKAAQKPASKPAEPRDGAIEPDL